MLIMGKDCVTEELICHTKTDSGQVYKWPLDDRTSKKLSYISADSTGKGESFNKFGDKLEIRSY